MVFVVDLLWGRKALDAGLTSTRSNSLLNETIDPLRGVGVALEVKAATFAWDLELKAEDLRNINFRADAGKV